MRKFLKHHLYMGAVSTMAVATMCLAVGCADTDADGASVGDANRKPMSAPQSSGTKQDVVATPSLELSYVAPNEVVAAEEQGGAYVDPASGKMTWRAFTCRNPSCPGQGRDGRPFRFAPQLVGAVIGANGRVTFPQATIEQRHRMEHPECPACGLSDHTGRFDPPEVVERREALLNELTAARQARREA
ncbi:MAG: hypothetical protein MI757_05585, partial [Pirellulales bacterium]|nr:hypothetical protein [Pirellulales bacterium]